MDPKELKLQYYFDLDQLVFGHLNAHVTCVVYCF